MASQPSHFKGVESNLLAGEKGYQHWIQEVVCDYTFIAEMMLPHKEEGLNVNYENCKVSQNLTSHQLLDINFLSSCYVKSNKKDNIHNSEA